MILKVEADFGAVKLWDSLEDVTINKAECGETYGDVTADEPPQEVFILVEQRKDLGSVQAIGVSAPPPQVVIVATPGVDPKKDVLKEGVQLVSSAYERVHFGWYITATRRDKEPFSVFFDTTGYLLNNDGKTIEVLR